MPRRVENDRRKEERESKRGKSTTAIGLPLPRSDRHEPHVSARSATISRHRSPFVSDSTRANPFSSLTAETATESAQARRQRRARPFTRICFAGPSPQYHPPLQINKDSIYNIMNSALCRTKATRSWEATELPGGRRGPRTKGKGEEKGNSALARSHCLHKANAAKTYQWHRTRPREIGPILCGNPLRGARARTIDGESLETQRNVFFTRS